MKKSLVFCMNIMLIVCFCLYSAGAKNPASNPANLPANIYAGSWATSHMQGMAIDDNRQYMYFSFTSMLVKTDMNGKVLGSVTGLTGHLGDLAFYDGKVYGSLEYKDKNSFYIAVFDVKKITETNMPHNQGGVLKTMYLEEVVKDYTNTLDAGEYDNKPGSMGHRYGCSGIDGITFGTVPGSKNDKIKLMLAYGIYGNIERKDNDYQVILQYDLSSFTPDNQDVLDQAHYHTKGPKHEAKYFVFTGNTTFGVQNLEYDKDTHNYWMAAYVGKKTQFPNYPLYLIDGNISPKKGIILGQKDSGETGLLLQLAEKGTLHEASGVYGYTNTGGNAATGFISLGKDYFYISNTGGINENGVKKQYGYANLFKLDRKTNVFDGNDLGGTSVK